MARLKGKGGRISVFKGREAKLNRAIFHILALKGPQTIYEVCKEVRALRHLKHTKYTNVNRRVRALESSSYLEKAGTRETQAGFQVTLYQLSARGYLAILLNRISLDEYIEKADVSHILDALAVFVSYLEFK